MPSPADRSASIARGCRPCSRTPWSSLNPRLRVRDTIAEALVVNKRVTRTEARHRVALVLEQVGVPADAASRYPHEFSGGQRQRIALASALASDPELIVLDEPVSALDVSIRAQIMNLLKDLQEQRKVAYLLVAHNLATVRYIAHRTAVMYLGRIVEYAETEALFQNPRHPYTKALFAAALPADPEPPAASSCSRARCRRRSIRRRAVASIRAARS